MIVIIPCYKVLRATVPLVGTSQNNSKHASMIGETLALEPVQALIAAFTSMESRGTSLRLRILLCFCLKTCQNLRDTKLHPYKPLESFGGLGEASAFI